MSADNTWNLLGSVSRILPTTVLSNGGPAPSLSAVTFFVNFNSGANHLPWSATQAAPVRRIPCTAQRLSRPIFSRHNSVLGNAQHCSCSTIMTNKDALSHVTCKGTDAMLSDLTEPNFLSKLRHWLSPSSVQFVSFRSFFHLCQLSFCS